MKHIFSILFILICSNLFSQNNSFIEKFETEEVKLEKRILSMMKATKVKGIGVGLTDSSGLIWSKGYGYKDLQNKMPIDKQTVFCVGSISKLFTGIAIMQLQEAGKIDINKSVKEYIPEFAPLGADDFIKDINIKSLLMHQSGLPSDNYAMFFNNKGFSAQRIIDYINTQYVCTPPYTIFSYSNIGYSLLGAIVERVSGENFADYIKNNITAPLQMHNSSFGLNEQTKPLLSKQYLKNKKEYEEPSLFELLPAGGFYSNIEDMSIFAKMLINKGKIDSVQILNEASFSEMTMIQNSNIERDYDMSMGLTFFITLDGTWFKAGGSISHGGNTMVFHSGLTILPHQNLAIFISSNSKNGLKIVPEIERLILDKALETKGIDSSFSIKTISKPQQKSKSDLVDHKKYEGNYSFLLGPLKLQSRKKSLILKSSYPLAFVLKPEEDSTFSVKFRLLGIPFKNKDISKMWFDIVENDTIIVVNSWDRNFYFSNKIQKMTDEEINKWKHLEGKYVRTDSSDIATNMKVKIKNGFVQFKSSKYFDIKLRATATPINNSMLKVAGLGRTTGDIIVFNKEANLPSFNFSGINYRKIK